MKRKTQIVCITAYNSFVYYFKPLLNHSGLKILPMLMLYQAVPGKSVLTQHSYVMPNRCVPREPLNLIRFSTQCKRSSMGNNEGQGKQRPFLLTFQLTMLTLQNQAGPCCAPGRNAFYVCSSLSPAAFHRLHGSPKYHISIQHLVFIAHTGCCQSAIKQQWFTIAIV